jgi:predicted RecA/RadA family phage recombinase
MNNYRQENTAPHKVPTPVAGVTSGLPVIVGGVVWVPQVTVAAADVDESPTFDALDQGVFVLTKATGTAYAFGDPAYFDFGSDGRIEATGTYIGIHVAAAESGDTTARVMILPTGAGAYASPHIEHLAVFLENGNANTKTQVFRAPFDGKITGISYYTTAKPTSSAGTVVLTAQNAGVADATLLNAATFDLEGATENAVTAMALTATAASLVMAAGSVAEFICAAGNADVVGGAGVHFWVTFQRT